MQQNAALLEYQKSVVRPVVAAKAAQLLRPRGCLKIRNSHARKGSGHFVSCTREGMYHPSEAISGRNRGTPSRPLPQHPHCRSFFVSVTLTGVSRDT